LDALARKKEKNCPDRESKGWSKAGKERGNDCWCVLLRSAYVHVCQFLFLPCGDRIFISFCSPQISDPIPSCLPEQHEVVEDEERRGKTSREKCSSILYSSV
jgi:hypothetical protein